MIASPGIIYSVRGLPRVFISFGLVYLLVLGCRTQFHLEIPTFIAILSYVLAVPVIAMLTAMYRNHAYAKQAAAHGALLPPKVRAKLPGGLDLLAALIRDFKHGYPGDALLGLTEEYGNTFNIPILLESRVFTCEPEYIKAILATQFDSFEKGPQNFDRFRSLLGTGVFNSDGEMWKFHRAITRPFFSKERITHFDIFEHHAVNAIGRLKERQREGYPIDFQDLVSRFTLDSATDFLFGTDVGSLSGSLPYPSSSFTAPFSSRAHSSDVFTCAFTEAQQLTALRARYGPIWPLIEFWTDKVKKHRVVLDDYIDPILKNAVAKKNAAKSSNGTVNAPDEKEVKDGETLLDYLVKHTEDVGLLRDEILNLMVAGRDTTASTLTFTIYMLAEHPTVLHRLREEILTKVGSNARPTYDDIRDMKYLRAVINETLRLYPPVPFNARATTRGTVWPSKEPGSQEFYIPADTRVIYSVFLMHRRKDLWGPDALEFDPDRFLDERLHRYLTPNPFIFLPFNAGRRICLGQQFAYNETAFFLIRLLQSVSAINLASDAQPVASRPPAVWAIADGYKAKEKIWPKSHLTLYASGGLWVRMEETSSL